MKFANPLKKARTIASLLGHTIEFPGREGEKLHFVHVPDVLIPECVNAGLATEEDLPEQEESKVPQRPASPEEVKSQLFDAFEMLVKAGERDSFSGNGKPKVKAVQSLVGWEVDNATLTDAWSAYQLASANGDIAAKE